jgi:hypothetical protein
MGRLGTRMGTGCCPDGMTADLKKAKPDRRSTRPRTTEKERLHLAFDSRGIKWKLNERRGGSNGRARSWTCC